MPDEFELWEQYVSGDHQAFKTIYERYYDAVYSYAYQFNSDPLFIKECIQDLFVKLWRNKKNLSKPSSPKHYLLKALRNVIYNKLSSKRRNEICIGSSDDLDILQKGCNPEPGFNLSNTFSPGTEYMLRNLTSRQREAIYLFYIEEMSYREIANFWGIKTKAVYKLIYRAMTQLRSVLK